MSSTRLDRLASFVDAVTQLHQQPVPLAEADMVERASALLRGLIANDDWLPDSHAAPHPQYYQQHLLHADPLGRFSLVGFVWGPGQRTPVHDHTVWGIIGMLRGAEVGQRYGFGAEGRFGAIGTEHRLDPGQLDIVSPTVGDIHVVRNAYDDRVSVSVHLYGADIGKVRRHVYDSQTGAQKEFVSGYSAVAAPVLAGISQGRVAR